MIKGQIIEFNSASLRLYIEKCGWEVEGIYRQHAYLNGHYYDVFPVSILRDEFLEISKGTPYRGE